MNHPELQLFLREAPSNDHAKAREPPQRNGHTESDFGNSMLRNHRTLKIEATGDFFYGKVKPKIRICGKWLEQAGFKPGDHVQVIQLEKGKLELQAIETPF